MKTVEHSPTRLVLEDRPWFIGLLLILMALVFLGGGMTLLAERKLLGGVLMVTVGFGVPLFVATMIVQRVRLTLDSRAGQITRVSRSARGLTEKTYALSRLAEARLDASTDSDGTTYRMVLTLMDPPETVPFTSYYSSGGRSERLCAEVNRWHQAQDRGAIRD